MSENMTGATKAFPVIPLDDAVVLPGMVVPLDLSDSETRAAVDAAANGPTRGGKPQVLLVPRLDGTYAKSGVVAIIEQTGRMAGSGRMVAVVRGTNRAAIGVGTTGPGAALWVEAIVLEEPAVTSRTRELAKEYKDLAIEILQHREAFQVVDMVQQISDPSQLADSAGYAPYLKAVQKVELLETLSVDERLEKLLTWGREHLVELDVSESIRKDVEDGMEKQQREFLLRRQLAAIRKELAELDGKEASEEEDYRSRVETADLPDKVREAALKEVDKLERSGDQNPEAGWIRTWLDTVLEMPWSERSEDSYDIAGARAVLDADHAGLDDVKERIVEYLAVRKKRQDKGLELVGGRRSGAVLALVGPPGVGKTSLGESVARAMGRKFVRVALGGVRDEAEIRGHRRTYVGALPGRIVRAIKDAGTMNPVVLLDEIDKVGADYRGDPTAALLEVLDPAQNHTFRDHYLEVELDLSDVVFLATANVLESIPGPLLDRMELVRLDGYTEDEKVLIGRDHLLPRQIDRAGLSVDEVEFDDEALRLLAQQYTREAGVRDLERAISRVLRKVAAKTALADSEAAVKSKAAVLDQDADVAAEDAPGADAADVEVTTDVEVTDVEATAEATAEPTAEPAPEGPKTKLTITVENLKDYLGRPRHTPETADRLAVPGVATGLAVTGAGGEVLFVEASLSDPETGGTGVTLTGQLGDVMKESAQIALSYLRSHGAELELPVADLSKRAVHVHVPAGAQPKDGPSAGVTMTTALASLLSGRLVRKDVAMTGEVSLTGRVLPIGGVKQKLLAAHQAGATTVLLPKRNGPDLDDVPAEVLDKLTVHLVGDVREVLDLALEPAERPVAVAAV
ncbi:ATP-dependent protease La [Catenulispora acidiphila DSM 44928]|uniref:Lon protease n=1 Tax=Catenulispora acidiphila (strain DSM 44928 / JCM 14897 / NBRC 102108 / NRRL B-24433 / ID139908) TaxID=479433 RepID=C7QC70_CATAD|nr:endopeptidase La [Catenulispora acidiphila]ACU74518.1 ATP-dependent protease La [Catenulispora acidiphila DSM 44928]